MQVYDLHSYLDSPYDANVINYSGDVIVCNANVIDYSGNVIVYNGDVFIYNAIVIVYSGSVNNENNRPATSFFTSTEWFSIFLSKQFL